MSSTMRTMAQPALPMTSKALQTKAKTTTAMSISIIRLPMYMLQR